MNKNSILLDLSESDHAKFGKEPFEKQSVPQKVFSSIWAVESEVNNGGFAQYFLNVSSETAGFVVEALNTVGARQTADICRRATAAAFPAGLPKDPRQISLAAGDFSEETLKKLAALDREFSRYPDNLTELLFAYVSRFPTEFGELPTPDETERTGTLP